MKKYFGVLLVCMISAQAIAQSGWFQPLDMQGQMYMYWGYNRAGYSNSNIDFKGDSYRFTLTDVVAHDRPTQVGVDPYFKAAGFTIPQYNYKVGYFFGKHWNVGIGMDHMKYIMDQNQVVNIDGYVVKEVWPGIIVREEYNNSPKQMTEDFLTFEHTDGLNYLNVEFEYFENVYTFSDQFLLNVYGGGGLGLLIPKSNVKLMGYERNDSFHVAGYGFSAKGGLSFTFFKYLFLRSEVKGGYINMPDILVTTGNSADRASQDFMFGQWNFVLGGYIPLR